jgi:hypothetical protein
MLMKNADPEHYVALLAHLVWMGSMPASKAHAWFRVQELEKEPYGFYVGIQEEFLSIMRKDRPAENA